MSKRKRKATMKNVINWSNYVADLNANFPSYVDKHGNAHWKHPRKPYPYNPTLDLPTQDYTARDYRTMQKDIGEKNVILSDGKSTQDLKPFTYPVKKKSKPKTYKVNSKVPRTQSVTTPKGTHWQNVTQNVPHKVTDYENTDVYSDFDGWFNLEKIGNKFHCWVTLKDAHVIDDNGKPVHEINGYDKPIADKTWIDSDGNKSFPLASIAAFFGKQNILEDNPPNGFPIAYKDVNMGCRSVKYWNIFDGGNDASKPHIIAHKGENIIIDTGKMKVYNTDGKDLTKITSFESAFPPLFGSQINDIDFYPTVGKDCDVQVTYVPRIR